jgi:hypothetical protein
MKHFHPILAAALALAAPACGPAISVGTDYDTAYNFTRLSSYAWAPVKDQYGLETLVGQRIVNAIDRELAARHMTKTTMDQNPDFVVAYHTGVRDKTQVVDWGYDWGFTYGPWYTPSARTYHVETYREGTLIIDLVDWKTKQMIWRGVGRKALDPNPPDNPERLTKSVNDAVNQIMAGFPPASARKE